MSELNKDGISPEVEEGGTATIVADKFEITPEILASLSKNPEKISEFKKADRNVILNYVSEKLKAGEKLESLTPMKSTSETKEAGKEEKPKPREKSEKTKELEKLRKEEEDIDAKIQARVDALEKKKALSVTDEELKADDVSDDVLGNDDKLRSLLKDQATKISRLEKILEKREKAELDEAESEIKSFKDAKSKVKYGGVFAEIEALQSDFSILSTKTPFAKINEDYTIFLDTLAEDSGVNANEKYKALPLEERRKIAYQIYDESDEFRTKVDAKRPKSLSDETDMKIYQRILDINNQKRGGSLKGAFLEWADNEGILADQFAKKVKEARIKGADETISQINKKTIPTISSSDGPGRSPTQEKGDMTVDIARETVRNLIDKSNRGSLSRDERLELKASLEYIQGERNKT